MSRCGLQDIGGLYSCFGELREFYLPFNDVSDLSPLNGHEYLEVLDLEGNAVADASEVEVLRTDPRPYPRLCVSCACGTVASRVVRLVVRRTRGAKDV